MSDSVPFADFQGLSDDATRYLMKLSVLRAENARLREALVEIASYQGDDAHLDITAREMRHIARAALSTASDPPR